MSETPEDGSRPERWIGIGVGVVAVLGLVALLGWGLGKPILASLGPTWIPMAPSTAVLFVLSALAVLMHSRWPRSPRARRGGQVLAVTVAVGAVAVLALSAGGGRTGLEHLGLAIAHPPGLPPTGHMSPVTAACFLAAALALLCAPRRGVDVRRRTMATTGLAVGLLATSLMLLLAYLYGAPMFCTGTFIPPAATTSLAFLVLGSALLGLVAPGDRGRESGPETTWRSAHVLVPVFLMLATGVAAAGLLYYRGSAQRFQAEVERNLAAVAEMKVNDLMRWREERLGDAAIFHDNASFSGLVREVLEPGADAAAQERLRLWLAKALGASRYNRICLHDAEGIERLAVPDTPAQHAQDLEAHLAAALSSGQVGLTDLNRNEHDGRVYLRVLVPIMDVQNGGRALGVLVLRIDAHTHLYPLLERWPIPTRTAESLLVRREGDEVVFLSNLRFRADAALRLRRPLANAELPAALAASGYEGVLEGVDYHGAAVLACLRAVPGSPWFLVACIDRAEVYAPLRHGLWVLVGAVVSLVVAAGAVVGQLWRQQSVRFFRERYDAAEARRRQEERYHRTLDSMLEGCQIISPDWRYLYVNDAAAAHGRRSKQELLGRTLMECYPGIAATAIFAAMRQSLEEGQPQHLENEFHYPDGASAWFELSIQPVPEGIFTLSIDITARKQAEERLRHLNDVLRAIRDVNQLIVHERDREALLRRACEILITTRGYRSAWVALRDAAGHVQMTAEAGIGADFAALRAELERGEWPECCRRALGQPDGLATLHNTDRNCGTCPLAHGYRETAALAGVLGQADREFGVLVVALPTSVADDAEERALFAELVGDVGYALHSIEQEQKREHAETLYHTLFEASADGILIADAESRKFRYANPAICRFLGYSQAELIALGVADLHPEADRPQRLASFAARSAGSPALLADVPCIRKDGSLVYADVSAMPLRVDGQACNAGFFRDSTERRRAAAAHSRLESQLQQAQKMESVGRLAGGVAHDFNNLLMGIMNYVELCRERVGSEQPLREWLDEITADAQRSANLTRQLLAFARKQTIAPQVLDLNVAVEGMLKMLRRLIGEDIDLAWMPGARLWPARLDPGQVDQVLANLCVNARDAIGGVGKVTIETDNASIDEAYCAQHAEATPGAYVVLAVSDNGCGMDAATLAHLFEPFFTTKPRGEGTGLGLATVYGIVRQNEGFINVYSEPGKGTTFRLYLPRFAGASAAAPAPAAGERPGGNETVLLVEDEKSVRVTTALFLEQLGYTVLAAASPEEALEQAAAHGGAIQLLVTDVVMPGLSGRDLANRLVGIFPRLKCLFISGYTANVIAHRGILDAGVAFLAKPFNRDDIARKVRDVLDG